MIQVLIVGLKGVDSGKTTFARALLSYLRDEGFKVCGFKPMAGNNVWYDYDVVSRALSQGRLYGRDAKLLREVSTGDVQVELINPVHRLWSEPSVIDATTGIPSFILDRITFWPEDKNDDEDGRNVLVENTNLHLNGEMKLLKKLYPKAADVYRVENADDLNGLVKAHYGRAIGSAYRKICEEHDALVIEGYSDAALPAGDVCDLDLVVGVEPWQVSVYDAGRYLDAVRLSTPTYSREVSTGRVMELLRPKRQIEYQPSRPDERVERLKEIMPKVLEEG